jgi:hypothetical protein
MRIVFAADVLADPQYDLELSAVLVKIEDGWHLLEVPDPAVLAASAFFGSHPTRQRVLQMATQSAAWRPWSALHLRCVLVTAAVVEVPLGPPETIALVPTEARRLLAEPLRVFLENRITDGLLIDLAIDFFAERVVRDLREADAIRLDSPGGIGAIPVTLRHDSEGNPTRLKRTIVITDSDAPAPGQPSKDARRVRECCDQLGIPCLILGQRAIENYLPDEVLQAWANELTIADAKRATVAALASLTPEQRDHFPMKRGLPSATWQPEAGADLQRALFASVPGAERSALERGLDDDAITIFCTDGRRPPWRPEVTAEALRRRDTHGDLQDLARLIEAWL